MAIFFIQVTLQGQPEIEIYKKLDALMEIHGFNQSISGLQDKTILTQAFYYGRSLLTANSLCDWIHSLAATGVWPNVAVLVIEASNWAMIRSNS
ncbi:hypothetical protein [Granulicella sp. dw_53]|uniref:hypothetical protein n=1 Tax=Granulicella sp. dw_53 TaxID=2719792 RepID=UPI001BD1DFF4|nr:hypothetical protein [Granulicella sp. dw_53]